MPSLSVIIPNYNGESVICDCLGSVYGTKYPFLEVVLVDDASKDNSISVVRKYFPQVKILENRFNSGFARTVNTGIRASSGEILVLLNMDITLDADCLGQLAKGLVEDKEVGIAGPKMFFPDGKTIQHAGGKIRPNGVSVHVGRGELDSGQYDYVAEVDYLCGAVIALRRDLLLDLGCLDEGYSPPELLTALVAAYAINIMTFPYLFMSRIPRYNAPRVEVGNE
ncbi:MAG: glycosyltransferase [Candidatus Omnitrophica bacterium]|nr:glycosyltransferase [Candidatus Omnitrophota bacterium]